MKNQLTSYDTGTTLSEANSPVCQDVPNPTIPPAVKVESVTCPNVVPLRETVTEDPCTTRVRSSHRPMVAPRPEGTAPCRRTRGTSWLAVLCISSSLRIIPAAPDAVRNQRASSTTRQYPCGGWPMRMYELIRAHNRRYCSPGNLVSLSRVNHGPCRESEALHGSEYTCREPPAGTPPGHVPGQRSLSETRHTLLPRRRNRFSTASASADAAD